MCFAMTQRDILLICYIESAGLTRGPGLTREIQRGYELFNSVLVFFLARSKFAKPY
ncbi:hypothetical protein Hanom_Chr17g01563741 [Helianthus anomalus]